MLLRLFLLFTLIPMIELYLLLQLGKHMGLLPTVGLVIFTGALGAWLARTQGLNTLKEIRTQQAHGQMPTSALVDGLLILIAGAVLLTPGLLTDFAGFFLLIPQGRRLIRQTVKKRIAESMRQGHSRVVILNDPPGGSGPGPIF